jgi:hypothetical protein
MTQQMFDDAIGELPPSTVDVAGIVRRQKRNRRLLRAPLAMVAVVAVAAGVAYAGFGGPGPADPGQTSPPPAGPSFRLVVDTAASKKLSAEQLTKAYDEAVRGAVPGARWSDGHPPAVTDKEAAPPTVFMFGAGLIVDGRTGSLVIQVAGPVSVKGKSRMVEQPTAMLGCKNPDGGCTTHKDHWGRELTVREWRWSATNTYTSVAIRLPHDRVLTLESHQTLLTADQVSKIVSDLASRIAP